MTTTSRTRDVVTPLFGRDEPRTDPPFADDPRPRARRTRVTAPPGRRSRSFVTLLALVLVLNLAGLAMILSASAVMAEEDYGSPWYQFLRQSAWLGVGLVVLVVVMRTDYRRWRRWSGVGLLASLALLLLVFVPKVGTRVNGATRWVGWGPLSVQPSEFTKLALIVFWADLLGRRARWIDEARLTVVPVLVTFGAAAALIMLQPNLGTTAIIFVTMLVMLFVAGTPGRWLAGIAGAGLAAGAVFALAFPWRWRRIAAFADPWQDPQGVGYQPIEAKAAVATGGFTGIGLGQGRSKWGFLPEAHTDFIYAVIAEETGWIGAVAVVALFVTLGVVGFRVAMGAPDRFGMLLVTGITTWFLAQAVLNIGQSVGALPVMGVPLPFVSSGGSSLLVGMVAAGMLCNVARQTR